jgi:hypothetical protein
LGNIFPLHFFHEGSQNFLVVHTRFMINQNLGTILTRLSHEQDERQQKWVSRIHLQIISMGKGQRHIENLKAS